MNRFSLLLVLSVFLLCSCSRTSSYYVRLGNIGNTGVIVHESNFISLAGQVGTFIPIDRELRYLDGSFSDQEGNSPFQPDWNATGEYGLNAERAYDLGMFDADRDIRCFLSAIACALTNDGIRGWINTSAEVSGNGNVSYQDWLNLHNLYQLDIVINDDDLNVPPGDR